MSAGLETSSAGARPVDTRPASVVATVVNGAAPDAATTTLMAALDASTATSGIAMVTSTAAVTFRLRKYGPERLFSVDVDSAVAASTPIVIPLTNLPPDIAILIVNASGGAAVVSIGVVLRP